MTGLLDAPPYSPRDDGRLLSELIELTRWHLEGCTEYKRVWPSWSGASQFASLPYLHVSGLESDRNGRDRRNGKSRGGR